MKKFLTTLTIAILLTVAAFAQDVHRETTINMSSASTEALNPVLFPYNGGSGFFTISTSTVASYQTSIVGNVAVTRVDESVNGGMTLRFNYTVPAATLPGKASITVNIAGYSPQTLNINIAGKGGVSSSASYASGKVVHGALATFWGSNLGNLTQAQSLPLPLTLSGTQIFKQKLGDTSLTACPLLFVSPQQVNFQLPDDNQYGMYVIYSLNAAGEYYSEYVNVNAIAPDIFTINSTGAQTDHAAIAIQRNDGGQTTYENPTITYQNGKFVMTPVRLTAETYLLFYGSGARKDVSLAASYAVLDDVTTIPLTYAGPQGFYVGLDQLAVKLPTSTTPGEHKIKFVVNGWHSNPVTIPIQ